MFLHLCTDEKFIDSAWAAFDEADPGNHRFAVIGGSRPLRFVRSFSPERLTPAAISDRTFLRSLSAYEAVILHSLNPTNRAIVINAPPANFVWIGWGFDYYPLISGREDLWLPMTRAAMAARPTRERLAKWLDRTLNSVLDLVRNDGKSVSMNGNDLLGRIAIFAPVLHAEYELIRSRHPHFQPKFLSWNYGVHDILANTLRPASRKANRVIVGNSATPECNHIDAFALLAASGFNGDVICPLSYGEDRYRALVIQAGRSLFGSRFVAMTEFLEPSRYAQVVAESSHLVMLHLRQQGLTNVLLGLSSGCRVIVHGENPLAKHLAGCGFEFDDAKGGVFAAPLTDEVSERNRSLVDFHYGRARHAMRTEAFVSDIRKSFRPPPASAFTQKEWS